MGPRPKIVGGEPPNVEQNRKFFRGLNEHLAEAELTQPGKAGDWRYFCECGAPGCTERIELSREDFKRLVRVSDCRMVAVGHVDAYDEVIVRGAGYMLVSGRGS